MVDPADAQDPRPLTTWQRSFYTEITPSKEITMTMRRMLGYFFGFAAVLSMVLSACSSTASAASNTLNVDLADFAFTPNQFTIPAGKPITLNLTNKGANVHEFVIMKAGTDPAKVKVISDALAKVAASAVCHA